MDALCDCSLAVMSTGEIEHLLAVDVGPVRRHLRAGPGQREVVEFGPSPQVGQLGRGLAIEGQDVEYVVRDGRLVAELCGGGQHGKVAVMSFPLRLNIRATPLSTVVMARGPSHFISNAHPAPPGSWPSVASVGDGTVDEEGIHRVCATCSGRGRERSG